MFYIIKFNKYWFFTHFNGVLLFNIFYYYYYYNYIITINLYLIKKYVKIILG